MKIKSMRVVNVGLLIWIMLFLFSACGYRPTTSYTKTNIGDKIYLEVKLDKAEPENGVYVREKLIGAIYDRLGARIVSKEQADSTLIVKYSGTSSSAVKLSFNLQSPSGTYSKTIHVSTEELDDDEYVSVGRLSHRVDTLSANFESAVDEFVAYLATLGG